MQDVLGFFERVTASEFAGTVITAVVILAATAICVRVATRLIRGFVKHSGHDLPSSSIFVNIARATIWLIGFSLLLSTCFGIDVSALVAALGVGGIAVSLGFRDTISNLIGGLQVSMLGIVAPGDNIAVGSLKGIVQDVTWRQTVVRAGDGHDVVVPNSVINAQTIEKFPPVNVVRVPVSLATDGRDLDEVAKAVESKASAAAHGAGAVTREPRLLFTGISEMAVNGVLTYEMEQTETVSAATDAIIRSIAPYARNSFKEASAEDTAQKP